MDCSWTCTASKVFEREAAGDMEKEQAGLVLPPTLLGDLQQAGSAGSFLVCAMGVSGTEVAVKICNRCRVHELPSSKAGQQP